MKKRRALLLILFALLFVVGIPTGLLVREYRWEQANRDLIAAIKADDTDKALAALKAGADPNSRDHSEDKPLSLTDAVKRVCDHLLNSGAKSKAETHSTALLLLVGQPWHEQAVENPTLVKALLDAGADPNLTGDEYRFSSLMLAALNNSFETFRLLLSHGANVRQKDADDATPLQIAAKYGTDAMVNSLLVLGADIEAKDINKWTALHNACQVNKQATIELLLRFHANINARDKDGNTPLDFVRYDRKIVHLLRNAGAKTGQELDAENKRVGQP